MTAPADQTPVDDLAPTPIEELIDENGEIKEDDEGEDGKGGKGDGGGKKPNAGVGAKKLDDEDLSAYDSEKLIDKLKMLVWAPFSSMVPGASSFESEHDLKRTLFLGQLGMITDQIDPQDIADPDFINRLEQRNQQRQKEYGIDVMSAAGSAAAIGGAVTGLQEVSQEKQQKQPQRQDLKFQASQPLEASTDAQVEADDKRADAAQKQNPQAAAQTIATLAPEDEENSFAAEIDKEETPKTPAKEEGLGLGEIIHILDQQKDAQVDAGINAAEAVKSASGFTALTELFTAVAHQTDYNAPEQRVDLKFADPAPKMTTVSPMGGV